MTAVNEDAKFEFMLPKSAYADYITPGLAGSVNANDRSSNGMIPFEVDTNNSDAVASVSATSHNVTTDNKTITFNTGLLEEAAYADYSFTGLAGSANEEAEEGGDNSEMDPFEVDTNNSDAVASVSATSHNVTTDNKTITFNTGLLEEAAYADYSFTGLAGSANEEAEEGGDNSEMDPFEVDTNNSDAVASASAPDTLSAQAASAPDTLSAQAASAPDSSTRALLFLDTQIDKLNLEISNFDNMFMSYTQDQRTLRDCTFVTVD